MENVKKFNTNHNNEIDDDGKMFSEITSLEKFSIKAFKVFVDATKSANRLPSGKNRDLYESCPAFQTILKFQQQLVLSNMCAILKHTDSTGNIEKRDDEDKFEMIVDVNDSLMERVSITLDEISGIHKNTGIVDLLGNHGRELVKNKPTHIMNSIINKTKNMEKPQLKFKDKINNNVLTPFEPKIKYKFNFLKPLSVLMERNDNGVCEYSHPYEFELSKFKPHESELMHREPILYKSLELTPFKLIDEKEDVFELVQDLQKYKEIAVDLEHHSYRSFLGFTCLLQISTRDHDYIIDALALRSDLEELNKVFTDPTIVKVFHGADSDVLWLQRDLAIYVVNMFDTHQAAKLLNFPNLSLAYLLKYYCDVSAQKHFQLADWRIRPLPEELLAYARTDTHYLLYIYDCLRNRLIEEGHGQKNLLNSVIFESSRICLKTYQKPEFDPDGYLDIYHRSKKLFDNRQKAALRKLFEWRDKTARDLDESLAYVLPNHMMLNISEILPREAQGILACCNPVPPPVRQNLLHLHQLILKAREEPLVKPVLEEQQFHRHSSSTNSMDSPLYCPHDLNHEEDFRDDLPVLLAKNNDSHFSFETLAEVTGEKCSQPIVDVFERFKRSSLSIVETGSSYPYARYKLAKKFLESSESKNSDVKETKRKNCENTMRTKRNRDLVEVEDGNLKECEDKVRDSMPENSKAEPLHTERDDHHDGIVTVLASCKRMANEGLETPSKKCKTESDVFVKKIEEVSPPIPNEPKKFQKPKNKRKSHRKVNEKQFVPFNYETINYDKYKTFTSSTRKKNGKSNRPRVKCVAKNIKISI